MPVRTRSRGTSRGQDTPPDEGHRPLQVAIVGTGLAGLATAYLLQSDEYKRYEVTLFEQGPSLSFDSQSVAVRSEDNGAVERVDLPMRASAGGYYSSVLRMYNHLGIALHPIRFLFVFCKALSSQLSPEESERPETTAGSYFIHASNLHQAPPPKPLSRGLVAHFVEIVYLIICHFWFTVACFVVRPLPAAERRQSSAQIKGYASKTTDESFAEYLERIWLPRRYVSHYLLPLMSSVSTCTHDQLLDFPASDLVTYKNRSHAQQHYVVCGGVRQVEAKLAAGAKRVMTGAQVMSVARRNDGKVTIRWQSSSETSPAREEAFDRAVLAVSPNVAAKIFVPLTRLLKDIPTTVAESSVLSPAPGSHVIVTDDEGSGRGISGCSHHGNGSSPSQTITLRTSFSTSGSETEALHRMPSGVTVSTCPLEPLQDMKKTMHSAKFTRTLRTPESKRIVNSIMRQSEAGRDQKTDGDDTPSGHWTNGEDNVWVAGSWCWDGMVLLEGCVVSAMAVAEDFDIAIPW